MCPINLSNIATAPIRNITANSLVISTLSLISVVSATNGEPSVTNLTGLACDVGKAYTVSLLNTNSEIEFFLNNVGSSAQT